MPTRIQAGLGILSFSFLSYSLIFCERFARFCELKRERKICLQKRANSSCLSFVMSNLSDSNRSQSLICHEQPEQIAHGRSFGKSDVSELLKLLSRICDFERNVHFLRAIPLHASLANHSHSSSLKGAHSCSFVKSDQVNCSRSLFEMSDFEQKSEEEMSEWANERIPTLKTGYWLSWFSWKFIYFFIFFFVPRVKEGPLSDPSLLLYVQSNPSSCDRSQVSYQWAKHIPIILK